MPTLASGATIISPLRRIAEFIRAQGAVPAIQLQHAGCKASARRLWHGGAPMTQEDKKLRGAHPWQAIGPSSFPLSEGKPVPSEIWVEDVHSLIDTWVAATHRAVATGFDVVAVHAAHGYLFNLRRSHMTIGMIEEKQRKNLTSLIGTFPTALIKASITRSSQRREP